MELRFYKYNLPFARSFKTAKGNIKSRRGIFLRLRKDGITALGEAAPLPNFSQEILQQVGNQIQELYPSLCDLFASDFSLESLYLFFRKNKVLPSLQFGLLTLGSFYLAQKEGKSLHQFLFPNASNSIALNAVIDLKKQGTLKAIQRAVAEGFNTIKIKASNDASFLSHLEKIREQYPEINIRLDANQSWSMQQARQFLQQAEPLDIEYCEEPLKHPDEKYLAKLSNETTIPIALDESLATRFTLDNASKIVPVLIIKPMVLGGDKMINKLKAVSKDKDTKLVFTSSLESGIGRLMTAALAAGLETKETAHGLATGDLLATDIWDDARFIKKGSFIQPNAAALRSLMQNDLNKLKLEEIKF